MPRRKTAWDTVQIPKEITEEIEKIIDKTKLYTSKADFVKDAVRRRIEEVQRVTAYTQED